MESGYKRAIHKQGIYKNAVTWQENVFEWYNNNKERYNNRLKKYFWKTKKVFINLCIEKENSLHKEMKNTVAPWVTSLICPMTEVISQFASNSNQLSPLKLTEVSLICFSLHPHALKEKKCFLIRKRYLWIKQI